MAYKFSYCRAGFSQPFHGHGCPSSATRRPDEREPESAASQAQGQCRGHLMQVCHRY